MPRRSEEVMRELVDTIVTGEYAPGDRLPSLNDLRMRFGAGRDVLREALRELELRGLVVVPAASGAVVRAFGFWDLHDADVLRACIARGVEPGVLAEAIEARTAVELEAAALACARATDEDLLLLERFVSRMGDLLSAGPPSADDPFVDAEVWFHRTLALLSDNRVLAKLHEPLHRVLAEWRRARAPERDRTVVTHHRRILAGVTSRDPAEARAAVGDYGRLLGRWRRARR
jgi:DNA-binding FadR family transcriptional regulator